MTIDQLLIGCSDLRRSLAFFSGLLGLEGSGLRPDPPALPGCAAQLRAECRVGTAAASTGDDTQLHLVEFVEPRGAVRRASGPFDRCPKTVNFLCRNLPDLYRTLEARGVRFTSQWVDYEKAGVHYRDVHLPGPDAQNIGLLELVDGDYAVNDRGVGAIASVCFTQRDPLEAETLASMLALPRVFDETLSGEAVETLVGLPPGGALVMRLYGGDQPIGRFEFVSYRGATGENRYGLAQPPAVGLLHPRVRVEWLDAPALPGDAASTGLRLGPVYEGTLLGTETRSRMLEAPGGMRIELLEQR